jgi:hypothetical protein
MVLPSLTKVGLFVAEYSLTRAKASATGKRQCLEKPSDWDSFQCTVYTSAPIDFKGGLP